MTRPARALAAFALLSATPVLAQPANGQGTHVPSAGDTARVVVPGAPARVSPLRVPRGPLRALVARIDSLHGTDAAACGVYGMWEGDEAPALAAVDAAGRTVFLRIDCSTPEDARSGTIIGRLSVFTPEQNARYPAGRPLAQYVVRELAAWRQLVTTLRRA